MSHAGTDSTAARRAARGPQPGLQKNSPGPRDPPGPNARAGARAHYARAGVGGGSFGGCGCGCARAPRGGCSIRPVGSIGRQGSGRNPGPARLSSPGCRGRWRNWLLGLCTVPSVAGWGGFGPRVPGETVSGGVCGVRGAQGRGHRAWFPGRSGSRRPASPPPRAGARGGTGSLAGWIGATTALSAVPIDPGRVGGLPEAWGLGGCRCPGGGAGRGTVSGRSLARAPARLPGEARGLSGKNPAGPRAVPMHGYTRAPEVVVVWGCWLDGSARSISRGRRRGLAAAGVGRVATSVGLQGIHSFLKGWAVSPWLRTGPSQPGAVGSYRPGFSAPAPCQPRRRQGRACPRGFGLRRPDTRP